MDPSAFRVGRGTEEERRLERTAPTPKASFLPELTDSLSLVASALEGVAMSGASISLDTNHTNHEYESRHTRRHGSDETETVLPFFLMDLPHPAFPLPAFPLPAASAWTFPLRAAPAWWRHRIIDVRSQSLRMPVDKTVTESWQMARSGQVLT